MDRDNSTNVIKDNERYNTIAAEGTDALSLLAENEALRTKIVEIMLQCEELRERKQNSIISRH